MCGIVCALDIKQNSNFLRSQILEMSKKVRHRGPDWSGIHCGKNVLLAHERLAIVDPASGNQPIFSLDKNLILAANGEIYNHRLLKEKLSIEYAFQTNSDCEIILALYKEKGINFLDDLNGIFGFVLYDEENNEYLIARDHMGIIPLYMGWDKFGTFYVASELKALEGVCNKIEIFPPGHFLFSRDSKLVKWYQRDWMNYESISNNETDLNSLKNALEDADVQTRLQTAIKINEVAEPFIRRKAMSHLRKGRVVIFAAGTGNPYFTTDTAAALRAAEMSCDALLKGTQVDGVYSGDPKKDPSAERYDTLRYLDVLARDLKVMDASAISLCRENSIPIIVFSIHSTGAFANVIAGKGKFTVICERQD